MCPTYQNSTINDIEHQGVRVPANGTITTYRFLTSLPAGVTLVSNAPYYNPIISSTLYAGNSGSVTQTISDSTENYSVHFNCYGGSVSIAFNDASITPVLNMVSGEQATITVNNRSIKSFIITYLESGSKLKVDVYQPATVNFDA